MIAGMFGVNKLNVSTLSPTSRQLGVGLFIMLLLNIKPLGNLSGIALAINSGLGSRGQGLVGRVQNVGVLAWKTDKPKH